MDQGDCRPNQAGVEGFKQGQKVQVPGAGDHRLKWGLGGEGGVEVLLGRRYG